MFFSFISDITVYIFVLLVAAAAYQDVKSFLLPNIYSVSLIILYPAFVLSSDVPIDWVAGLGVGAITLTVGFALFALKYCGGGDAKLFAAVSLWAGPGLILDFTAITTFAGGLIALGLCLQQRATLLIPFLPQGLSSQSTNLYKKSMPYGAAIAIGAVYVAFTLLR